MVLTNRLLPLLVRLICKRTVCNPMVYESLINGSIMNGIIGMGGGLMQGWESDWAGEGRIHLTENESAISILKLLQLSWKRPN